MSTNRHTETGPDRKETGGELGASLARLAGPGRKAARLTEFDPIAERYLGAVERLAEYVDAM